MLLLQCPPLYKTPIDGAEMRVKAVPVRWGYPKHNRNNVRFQNSLVKISRATGRAEARKFAREALKRLNNVDIHSK